MQRHGSQAKLFDIPTRLPNGLVYRPDFITPDEEEILLAHIENLQLVNPLYRGEYRAKRRLVGFGWGYDFKHNRLIPGPSLPKFLQPTARKIAKWLDIPKEKVVHALITEYAPGTAIGWHVDTEDFEHVVGVSLSGWCIMRFRKLGAQDIDMIAVELEPRSAYIMQHEIRWNWQHSIIHTKALRYSITFRTLR